MHICCFSFIDILSVTVQQHVAATATADSTSKIRSWLGDRLPHVETAAEAGRLTSTEAVATAAAFKAATSAPLERLL